MFHFDIGSAAIGFGAGIAAAVLAVLAFQVALADIARPH